MTGPSFQRVPGVSSRIIDGRAVVVVMAREALHSLNESGTFLWNVIGDQERTRGELCSALARRYELSRERAESDVSAFLEQLLELGALEEGSRG